MPQSEQPARTPAISYKAAFFSHEERGEPTMLDGFFEHEAACFHEAGRAVASYLLGLGLSSVSVIVDCRPNPDGTGTLGYAFGGQAKGAIRPIGKAWREIKQRG